MASGAACRHGERRGRAMPAASYCPKTLMSSIARLAARADDLPLSAAGKRQENVATL